MQEMGFIYSSKEDVFKKYLNWYDLHMGNDPVTPKGLQFRQIAKNNLYDTVKRKCPDKIKEINDRMKDIKDLNKNTLKRDTKEPIECEDAVEKAVKTIYKAIHRKPYPARTKQNLFNCPQHQNNCPIDCKNLEKSMQIFNNRSVFRKHTTVNNADHIPDPNGEQPPAKGKGIYTIGLTEYSEND